MPKKTQTKSKSNAKTASPKGKAKNGSAGRPAGSPNFVPDKSLSVRETRGFRMAEDADVKAGLKWARIYAGDVESSNLLDALCKCITKKDPELLKLLRKRAK